MKNRKTKLLQTPTGDSKVHAGTIIASTGDRDYFAPLLTLIHFFPYDNHGDTRAPVMTPQALEVTLKSCFSTVVQMTCFKPL